MNDLKQLLKDVTYTVITGTDEIRVTDLVIDSRKAKEGCAFFCFIGANSDGHDYVKDVIQKGAAVIIIQKDPSISNKENLDINNIKTNIQSKEIKFNDDKFKIHANIYNNQYETTKLLSTTEEKYSLNELINDFQNPKESPELNKLNNNFSNNKNNSNDKNSNSKNDKNVGTSAFQIYYNKNIRNSIKEDNYLSDSDDEKNSINKKEEEKSENEYDIEEEMVKTILNDVPDSCLKNNNDKLNSLFIERTKKDFF